MPQLDYRFEIGANGSVRKVPEFEGVTLYVYWPIYFCVGETTKFYIDVMLSKIGRGSDDESEIGQMTHAVKQTALVMAAALNSQPSIGEQMISDMHFYGRDPF